MKITPILLVEAIEPSLKFWIDRLGFEKTVEVPDEGRLGFVILQKGPGEIMMQTLASANKDTGDLSQVPAQPGTTHLYIEVDDFGDTLKRLNGADVVVPERTTFYGMREIFVREPGGHVVGFAAKAGA